MTRLLAIVIVLALSHSTSLAEDAQGLGKIVVDASKSGGVWWFPQGKEGFDPAKDHQGKRLADYLKSYGWGVQELARGQDVTERLKGADVVIRTGAFFQYNESEARAYGEYVSDGGNVLLLQGFVRDSRPSDDRVAAEFGIRF